MGRGGGAPAFSFLVPFRPDAHHVARAADGVDERLVETLVDLGAQPRNVNVEHVWDYHFDPQTNVNDVHVSRLRAKIDKGFDKPLIHTIRGAGYMVRVGAEGDEE